MSAVPTGVIGSSASWGRISSRNRREELHLVKCYHDLPAVHQICKRHSNKGKKFFGCPSWRVDDDCGFFEWDKDEEISMVEKNKILEERIEELVSEMQRMDCQLTKLKSNDQGINSRVGANDILREEITNLRMKIAKEKQRRGTKEDELKAARDELMTVKLKSSRKDMMLLCLALLVMAFVMVRFMQWVGIICNGRRGRWDIKMARNVFCQFAMNEISCEFESFIL